MESSEGSGILNNLNCQPEAPDEEFMKQYEDALEELNYMLDINKDIKEDIVTLEDKIKGWFPTDNICTEKPPSSVSSFIPSVGSISEEPEKAAVEHSLSASEDIKWGKTKLDKGLDEYYEEGQWKVLQRAKLTLRRLEKEIENMIAKIKQLEETSSKNQNTIDEFQKETIILNEKKVETQYKIGIFNQHLQWFQNNEKVFKKMFKINTDRLMQLKIKIRFQASVALKIKSAQQRPAKLLNLHEEENKRQKEEYHYLMKQFHKLEDEIRNLKESMNCEADLRIFILPKKEIKTEVKKKPNYYWSKKAWSPPKLKTKTPRRVQTYKTTRNTKDHSPDCLKLFKAILDKKKLQFNLSGRLIPFSQAEIKHTILKKKEQRNVPLQLKEKQLAEHYRREERLLVLVEKSEDLMKVKYEQLAMQLAKVKEFRKYWENNEANLKGDIEKALTSRHIARK